MHKMFITSFPSANSSASPQEQSLQAFLFPVVPHTLHIHWFSEKNKNKLTRRMMIYSYNSRLCPDIWQILCPVYPYLSEAGSGLTRSASSSSVFSSISSTVSSSMSSRVHIAAWRSELQIRAFWSEQRNAGDLKIYILPISTHQVNYPASAGYPA